MQFWVLGHVGLGPDHDRWWSLVLSRNHGNIPEQQWWEVFGGSLPPPAQPAPLMIAEGREQSDVMYTNVLGVSFSARCAEVLASVGCRGFVPNRAVIYDRADREVVCTDAVWTQVQRGCAEPDVERGFDPLRQNRGTVGLLLDHSTCTGLDMFKPVKCATVVITDRIAKAIQSAGLRGYQLVRIQDYGRDMVTLLENPRRGLQSSPQLGFGRQRPRRRPARAN